LTPDRRGAYHYRVDFLDNLSTGTKAYVVVAALLALGLLAYDCGPSDADVKRSNPASRAVGPPQPEVAGDSAE